MPVEFKKECNLGQGFNFKQDEQYNLGFINTLVIGDANIAPDIKVAEPGTNKKFDSKSKGAAGGMETDSSSIFTKPVVAVLGNISWTTQPTDPIKFEACRVSVANMQMISMLTMQTLSKVVVRLSFVIYEYDRVHNAYYVSFCSYEGTAPSVAGPAAPDDSGWGVESGAKPIYGLIARDGNALGLTVNTTPADDIPGLITHEFNLTVAPTVAKATQKIKMQTSNTNKIIKGFGLPQA